MKLVFDEIGSENEQTILFLHAGGISGWMWDEQVKYFKDYHCIIPDLLEHGRNADVKPFTILRAAELVREIIGDCGKERVNLVGIGLGGQIVIKTMSKYPELVHHAMVSGTLVRSPRYKSLIKRLNQLLMVYAPVKNNDFYIKAYMRTYNMPRAYFNMFKQSTSQIETSSIERFLKENHSFKLPKLPATCESKLLVMAGEKDYSIIKHSTKEIMDNFQAKGAIALGGGHLWNMESPHNFNKVLDAWLQGEELPKTMISTL